MTDGHEDLRKRFAAQVDAAATRARWTRTKNIATHQKHMTLKFGKVKVTGMAKIDLPRIASCFAIDSDSDYRLHLEANAMTWHPDRGSPSHPHAVLAEGSVLCHSLYLTSGEHNSMRHEGILVPWLIGSIEEAFKIFNPNSLANDDWGSCPACHVVTYFRTHRCHRLGRNLGPSMDRFLVSILVGCGVTGSWSLPVLARTSHMTLVFDNDRVDPLNPNGLWPNVLRQNTLKIHAAREPRYDGRLVLVNSPFQPRTRYGRVDLLVLATDTARSRLDAVRSVSLTGSAWVVDLRVTPETLVVWAFQRGYVVPGQAWYDDISSYDETRQPCGVRHDNVPIVAGTAAASFLSWWVTRRPEAGMWVVPFKKAWQNMTDFTDGEDSEEDDEEVNAPVVAPTVAEEPRVLVDESIPEMPLPEPTDVRGIRWTVATLRAANETPRRTEPSEERDRA